MTTILRQIVAWQRWHRRASKLAVRCLYTDCLMLLRGSIKKTVRRNIPRSSGWTVALPAGCAGPLSAVLDEAEAAGRLDAGLLVWLYQAAMSAGVAAHAAVELPPGAWQPN